MSDRPDGLLVTQMRHQAAEREFEDAALASDRRMGRLIQDPAKRAVAFRAPVAFGRLGAFFPPRADSYL
jgi:hypothetical protein